MLVVFLSLTGQTKRFVHKLNYPHIELDPNTVLTEMEEPFILVVPTYDQMMTDLVFEFMDNGHNASYCKGIAGSGNRNFNQDFCATAKTLASTYQVPLLHMFEFQGTDLDVTILKEKVEEIG